jgi:ParB/RepB/Spo0J family partition protein
MDISFIDPDDVEVGERFRKDYALTDDFLDTVREKGIIQPITINQNMELVAGGRRLAAVKHLVMPTIPAIMRQTEDELDLRECEFIENFFRQDLNWQEKNASVARIHDLMKEKHGDHWTIRKSAELIGRSAGGIVRCLQMHEEVTKFPALAKFDKEDEAVKILRQMREKMASNILVGKHKERVEAFHGGNKEEENLKVISAMYAEDHFNVGDAFIGMQEMVDDKLEPPISFVEVDPPYGINLKEVKKGDKSRKLDKYEEIESKDYKAFLKKLCELLYQTTPANTRVCFWFGIEWISEVKTALRDAGFKLDPIPCLWTKRAGQTNSPELFLARAWEPFFIAWKGDGIPIHNRGRINVFDFPGVPAARKWHPTQRPIELMQEILKTFAWEGSICMIPFLGSGATLLACYREGINGFGWELNEENKQPFLAAVEQDIQEVLSNDGGENE